MKVQDEHYKDRTAASFSRQAVMKTLDATLTIDSPGRVSISFPFNEIFTQQNGFIHAGIISTVLDSACGYAAYTLMSAKADVLTVEFKVNLLRPAKGSHFTASAHVVKAGRSISVVEATLHSAELGEQKPVATMTGTIMTIEK